MRRDEADGRTAGKRVCGMKRRSNREITDDGRAWSRDPRIESTRGWKNGAREKVAKMGDEKEDGGGGGGGGVR